MTEKHLLATPRLNDGRSSWRRSPLTHVVRVYTHYVQCLFREENPLDIKFSDDPEQTDIIIKAAHTINADVINRTPVVLIHRSGFSFPSQGIGGDHAGTDFRTQRVTREALLVGGVFFTIIAEQDEWATDIAWWIVENIWLLKTVEGGSLYQGSLNFTISPPSTPQGIVQGDMEQLVAVQVSFPIKIMRSSSVEPLNLPRLKKIEAALKDASTEDTLLEVETYNHGT